ncbi:MAG: PorP/SprF family type IX secretion system membrane protein [Bacteroidota bacterium]|jgi:type IX secretion system PorP/SprF family membrane protein
MKTTYIIRRLFTAILAFGALTNLKAQDIHFSQWEYSPMTLNPALAGANSPMQAVINYRNQWSKVGTAYQTMAASFDARLSEPKRGQSGIFAAGLNFYNDRAGAQRISTNIMTLNLAYHLLIDRESMLGIGLYGAYGQRAFSSDGAQWMSQYDGFGYNASYVSGEEFNSPSFNMFDAGAGIVYSYNMRGGYMTQNIRKRINVGFTAFHVNRPKFSFIDQDNERLAIRYSAFFNGDFGIKNTRGIVQPGIYYQRQGGHQEIMFGMNYGYVLHEGSRATGFTRPMTLFLGMFYRLQDAAVARVMFEYDLFSLGFAYDINLSNLTSVTNSVGGFELFMRYNFGDGGGFRQAKPINRVRF